VDGVGLEGHGRAVCRPQVHLQMGETGCKMHGVDEICDLMPTLQARPRGADAPPCEICRGGSRVIQVPFWLQMDSIDQAKRPVGRPKGSGKKPGPAVPGPGLPCCRSAAAAGVGAHCVPA
jgi:hypothetical protein